MYGVVVLLVSTWEHEKRTLGFDPYNPTGKVWPQAVHVISELASFLSQHSHILLMVKLCHSMFVWGAMLSGQG